MSTPGSLVSTFLTGLQLAMESRWLCPWGEVKQRYLGRADRYSYSHGSELVFENHFFPFSEGRVSECHIPCLPSWSEKKALFRPVAEWNSPWMSRCWWVEKMIQVIWANPMKIYGLWLESKRSLSILNILYWFKLSSVLLVEGSAGYGFSMRSVPGVACLYLITRGLASCSRSGAIDPPGSRAWLAV